jgi:hypothetical protein
MSRPFRAAEGIPLMVRHKPASIESGRHVLHLPHDPDEWPAAGTATTFEVLQHRPRQVRLCPLDERFRPPDRLPGAPTQEQWLAVKSRFPVGSEITATVTDVYHANREYAVRFEDFWSVLEWTGVPPQVGTASKYTVNGHLEQTQRIMITPVPPQPPTGSPSHS